MTEKCAKCKQDIMWGQRAIKLPVHKIDESALSLESATISEIPEEFIYVHENCLLGLKP